MGSSFGPILIGIILETTRRLVPPRDSNNVIGWLRLSLCLCMLAVCRSELPIPTRQPDSEMRPVGHCELSCPVCGWLLQQLGGQTRDPEKQINPGKEIPAPTTHEKRLMTAERRSRTGEDSRMQGGTDALKSLGKKQSGTERGGNLRSADCSFEQAIARVIQYAAPCSCSSSIETKGICKKFNARGISRFGSTGWQVTAFFSVTHNALQLNPRTITPQSSRLGGAAPRWPPPACPACVRRPRAELMISHFLSTV